MPETFDFDTEINRRDVPALKVHQLVLGTDGADLFPAPPPVLNAMTQRLVQGLFGYETLSNGIMPALTNWLRTRHNWPVDPDHILCAPNVLNALSMVANLFTAPGDGIIIQPLLFFDFQDIFTENRRRVVANPLILSQGRYQIDFDALETCAADPRTKMLFLRNLPNPVGRIWAHAELLQLDAICRRTGVLVVVDEIHGDLTFDGHRYTPFSSLSTADAYNSITCLSPAKSFNIAACCGAFTVVPDPAQRVAFKFENTRLTVNKNNAFANVTMQAAYTYGAPWLDAVRAYIARNLALVRNRLADVPGVTLIQPEGTFLLWLDFRALGLTPDDLTHFLRHNTGGAITRGIVFGTAGAGFGWLNIACPRARLGAAHTALITALSLHSETAP